MMFCQDCARAIVFLLLLCPFAIAQDMPLSQVLIDNQGWELVAEGYKFTEGPAVDAEGNVFFTDVPDDKIYKINTKGNVSVFLSNTQRTNGLMFGPDGRLYGCRNGMREITAFDSKANATTIADEVPSNDIVVNSQGGIYFTDPANSKVWYIDPQGKKQLVDTGIERPNGIILWPDQATLVVADTLGANLWAFRVEPDGRLAHKQPYYTMRLTRGVSGSGADGMTVDRDGRLYVATHAGLQVFDTQGRLSGIIAKPQNKFLSNVVFGGEKLDTLYVTCTDKVYRRKTKVTGVRFFNP